MNALASRKDIDLQADLFPYVVADIGGTNARWGLVTGLDGAGQFCIESTKTFENKHHPRFEDSLAAYLDYVGDVRIRQVCVALAGPVLGDKIEMTNINWSFSITDVQIKFELKKFLVVNDFTALAYSTSALAGKDLLAIKEGQQKLAPRAILGAGTGLGMASLIPLADKWLPLSGEGGHTAFAPRGSEEIALCEYLQRKHGYISKETLLSGSGISRIYTGLADIRDLKVEPKPASAISALAASHEEMLAVDTMNLFCGVMGSVAADLALTVGALGGVYVGGGILPRVQTFLQQSPFVERFCEKAVMSHYVKDIPVFLIIADEPALIGAAALLAEHS